MAMSAGQQFSRMLNERQIQDVKDYSTIRPISTLQNILSHVRERIRIETKDFILDVAFNPDGTKIASIGGNSGLVRIFNRQGEELIHWQAYTPRVKTGKVKFSPDGQFIITGGIVEASNDETLSLWNQFSSVARIMSPKKETGMVNKVDLWDLSGKKIASLEGISDSQHLDFHPREQKIAAIINSDVKIFDFSGNVLTTIVFDPVTATERQASNTVVFSKDGNQLLIGGGLGGVRLYDLTKEQEILRFKAYSSVLPVSAAVNTIRFSPDNQFILTAGIERPADFVQGDQDVVIYKLWKYSEGNVEQVTASQTPFPGTTFDIGFSPHGNLFATPSGTVDSDISLRDSAGKEVEQLVGHLGWGMDWILALMENRSLQEAWTERSESGIVRSLTELP